MITDLRREEVMGRLSGEIDALLKSCDDAPRAPKTLFHFTDCIGLSGILTKQALWASLATALTDASETKYAVNRLAGLLQQKRVQPKYIPDHLLCDFLYRRVRFEGLINEARAYVASFCGGADEAIHWLHYGRSGTGVAIGFDTARLSVEQFSLAPVIYDLERQDELLTTLVNLVDESAGELLGSPPVNDSAEWLDYRNRVGVLGAHLTNIYLQLLSPRLKDRAFRAENEWRLISNEAWTPRAAVPTRPTLFRSMANRVVPFKEIKFDDLPATEIVLGSSSPMHDDEQAIAVLMENTLGKILPVRRSMVAVRP